MCGVKSSKTSVLLCERDRFSLQQHASLLRLCQAAQKVHQRAFAGAVEGHNRCNLPLIKRKLQILQRWLLAAGIGVIQIANYISHNKGQNLTS